MNILLIEHEKKTVSILRHKLNHAGCVVDVASEGKTGFEMALSGIYDVIIIERFLTKCDCLSLLQQMRNNELKTPVLFIAEKSTCTDLIEGLNSGADDYLVKPFSSDVLIARIKALARRNGREFSHTADFISIAGLILDPIRCEVRKESEDIKIKLTRKETLLLELLMRNHGLIINKELIFEKVWGYSAEASFNNIDLYIYYLRKKLNVPNIKTYRGVGYCFTDESKPY